MAKHTRKNHILPVFYLARFTLSGDREDALWVLDQETGRQWKSKPEAVAFEKDFYTVEGIPGIPPDAVENVFCEIEGRAASALRRIDAKHTMPTGEDYGSLMTFIATLALRDPAKREVFARPVKEIAQHLMDGLVADRDRWEASLARMKRDGIEIPDVSYESMRDFVKGRQYDIDVSRNVLIAFLLTSTETVAELLARRNWTVVVAHEPDGDFICSQHPVGLTFSDGSTRKGFYGPGFGLRNTVVTVPLGRRLALDGRFEDAPSLAIAYRDNIATVNNRSRAWGRRFLYSPKEDFLVLRRDMEVVGRDDLLEHLRRERETGSAEQS
jgi:hypothetical protein